MNHEALTHSWGYFYEVHIPDFLDTLSNAFQHHCTSTASKRAHLQSYEGSIRLFTKQLPVEYRWLLCAEIEILH